MTIVFFSNVLNHHQVALCDELYRQLGEGFRFVETGDLNNDRKLMGFTQFERPYRLKAAEYEEEARRLAMSADAAIMGAESYPYLKLRLSRTNKVTFSYSERWLKQGWKNLLSPNLLKLITLYLSKGHKRKWYVLSAGAYLANDFSKIGIFKKRVYKWGYFPKYQNIDTPPRSGSDTVRILWAGRFLDWKRPDMMVGLAERLLQAGHDFHITMIGDGAMMEPIKKHIDMQPGLSKIISLTGNLANDKVMELMASHDIFCFTSTRREGWGAVLGEAMSRGCCAVASDEAGATPLLIRHGQNGLIFKSGNLSDLCSQVAYLTNNPDKRRLIAENAKRTMLKEWDAATAACEFIKLAKIKLEDARATSEESNLPASPAHPM